MWSPAQRRAVHKAEGHIPMAGDHKGRPYRCPHGCQHAARRRRRSSPQGDIRENPCSSVVKISLLFAPFGDAFRGHSIRGSRSPLGLAHPRLSMVCPLQGHIYPGLPFTIHHSPFTIGFADFAHARHSSSNLSSDECRLHSAIREQALIALIGTTLGSALA